MFFIFMQFSANFGPTFTLCGGYTKSKVFLDKEPPEVRHSQSHVPLQIESQQSEPRIENPVGVRSDRLGSRLPVHPRGVTCS